VLDSSITIGVWADVADTQTNLAAFFLSNGELWPFDKSVGLDTKYYRGKSVSAFPVYIFVPTWERYNAGELYAKPLEEGDFIIMAILTLTDDFYNYYMSYYYSSQTNKIPLLASQPANMPCNIKGKDVVGYFAAAPAEYAMSIVTDPDKKKFDFDDE